MAVDFDSIISGFRDFFETYPDVSFPKYKKKIEDMRSNDTHSLVVDCDDLITYDQDIYTELVDKPLEIIPIAEQVLQEALPEFPDQSLHVRLQFLRLALLYHYREHVGLVLVCLQPLHFHVVPLVHAYA